MHLFSINYNFKKKKNEFYIFIVKFDIVIYLLDLILKISKTEWEYRLRAFFYLKLNGHLLFKMNRKCLIQFQTKRIINKIK